MRTNHVRSGLMAGLVTTNAICFVLIVPTLRHTFQPTGKVSHFFYSTVYEKIFQPTVHFDDRLLTQPV